MGFNWREKKKKAFTNSTQVIDHKAPNFSENVICQKNVKHVSHNC